MKFVLFTRTTRSNFRVTGLNFGRVKNIKVVELTPVRS